MRNLNKPPRYNVASIQAQHTLGGDVMQADENGQYVEWRDYAWLLADKQRLDDNEKELNKDINRLRDRYAEATQENARLKAENERLRKAGDAMASLIGDDYEIDSILVRAWNAAKGGKQS